MKHFHTRLQRSRLGRTYRRLRGLGGKPQPTSIYQEMEQGAVIGFFASALLALHFAGGSLSAAILMFATSLGLFVGAVIGAVLWIGSAPLPEDAVRAPAPGQKRSKPGRGP